MQIIHVYGPPASGKTLNRKLIADFLKCDAIIDGRICGRVGTHRVLKLAQDPPFSKDAVDECYDLGTVRKYILHHPGYRDRWVEPEIPAFSPSSPTEFFSAAFDPPIGDIDPRIDAAGEGPAKLDPEQECWRPQLGDVVRLKSCAQGMTVVSDGCCGPVDVSWFDGTSLQTETFPIECLVTGDRDDPLPF